ncbi:unknown protein [Seminavis robusta]|uniref:Transmembrane protein n=1 Tax=Seminavis robusta TaxID=568900 RepID=A0A9N8DNB1_9STRA|nr:unknown protein [Seminavis robusta]|eukprot:Sro243_g096730.1 n/a (307) ;mRNA; r:3762-4682
MTKGNQQDDDTHNSASQGTAEDESISDTENREILDAIVKQYAAEGRDIANPIVTPPLGRETEKTSIQGQSEEEVQSEATDIGNLYSAQGQEMKLHRDHKKGTTTGRTLSEGQSGEIDPQKKGDRLNPAGIQRHHSAEGIDAALCEAANVIPPPPADDDVPGPNDEDDYQVPGAYAVAPAPSGNQELERDMEALMPEHAPTNNVQDSNEGLAVANPVESTEDLPHADEHHEPAIDRTSERATERTMFLLGIGVFVVAIIVLAVIVSQSRKADAEATLTVPPSQVNPTAPSFSPTSFLQGYVFGILPD